MRTEPGIDAKEILAGIREWVAIESPTDTPAAVNRMMDRVQEEFAPLGVSIQRIPRDGFGDCLKIRSPWGGDGPGILVLSHLDTVHPLGTLHDGLPYRVEGDSAYGPGIYDMKGGAFLAFHAFRHLVRLGRETPLPITFLYNSDEELSSQSSRPLIEDEATQARFVFVTEPCRDGGAVVTSRKGTARFDVTFHGRPSHSGSKHAEGRSAIKEMARQILVLEEMTDYARDLTVNVGVVSGGTRPNVVPAEARMQVDMRIPSREVGDEMIPKVLGMTPFDPDIAIEIQGGAKRPPFERTAQGVALFEHARTLAAKLGISLREVRTGGASDGNFTAPVAPTLDGLGVDGEGAHTLQERLYVSSLEPRCTLMLRLFETLA
jgi:glutamate carboxypeptidase